MNKANKTTDKRGQLNMRLNKDVDKLFKRAAKAEGQPTTTWLREVGIAAAERILKKK